ncbi:MAG: hypothetical protein PHI84_20205 [Kiritimatiellae bacterium]|nr:hypothetical protein [Kiritimatiellia bacterium]
MIRIFVTITALLLLAACSTIRITDDIAVSKPRFIVSMQKPGETNWSQVQTTRFPWRKHQIYSWGLDVHTKRTNVTWFVICQYPHPTDHLREFSPTNYWGEITRDFSRVITPCEPLPSNGHIGEVYALMPGEPTGYYSIIPFVDYVPVYSFRYEIYEDNKSSNKFLNAILVPSGTRTR